MEIIRILNNKAAWWQNKVRAGLSWAESHRPKEQKWKEEYCGLLFFSLPIQVKVGRYGNSSSSTIVQSTVALRSNLWRTLIMPPWNANGTSTSCFLRLCKDVFRNRWNTRFWLLHLRGSDLGLIYLEILQHQPNRSLKNFKKIPF